jgi:hypothetical protein
MVYVDLNPIRAGIAQSPEDSEFTSIEARIRSLAASTQQAGSSTRERPADETQVPLLPFTDADELGDQARIPYRALDYLELIDWTGRIVRPDKRGAIDSKLPAIMQRLNIDAGAWQDAMRPSGNVFGRALGRLDHLRLHAEALKQSWIRGQGAAARLYPSKV